MSGQATPNGGVERRDAELIRCSGRQVAADLQNVGEGRPYHQELTTIDGVSS
jgi:hypothetical protein